jgi:hypothetical protein
MFGMDACLPRSGARFSSWAAPSKPPRRRRGGQVGPEEQIKMDRPDYETSDFEAALNRKRAAGPAMANTIAELKEQAHRTALYVVGGGSNCLTTPAERIVQDCLRALQNIPAGERFDADALMDGISFVYLHSANSNKEQQRRLTSLLKIGAGK